MSHIKAVEVRSRISADMTKKECLEQLEYVEAEIDIVCNQDALEDIIDYIRTLTEKYDTE